MCYDGELAKAMEFIFGSAFICKDMDVAKQVTFDPNVSSRGGVSDVGGVAGVS